MRHRKVLALLGSSLDGELDPVLDVLHRADMERLLAEAAGS